MDDGMGGDFTLIRNGYGYPTILTYTVSNLETGLPYRFYVISQNYVGKSVA